MTEPSAALAPLDELLPDGGESPERRLVKDALWIAALDAVPIEHRIEKVAEWLAIVDHYDLWRVLR